MATERGADDHRLVNLLSVEKVAEEFAITRHRAVEARALGGEAVSGQVEGKDMKAGDRQRVDVVDPAVALPPVP